MAKIYTAPFAQTPKTATAVVTDAASDINTDAPTNTVELITAGTEGAIVTRVTAVPRGTVTASSLLLFLSKDDGTTMRLIESALMGAHTVDATTAIPVTEFESISETNPIRLEAGDQLYVGSMVAAADGIAFRAEWMDY